MVLYRDLGIKFCNDTSSTFPDLQPGLDKRKTFLVMDDGGKLVIFNSLK